MMAAELSSEGRYVFEDLLPPTLRLRLRWLSPFFITSDQWGDSREPRTNTTLGSLGVFSPSRSQPSLTQHVLQKDQASPGLTSLLPIAALSDNGM